MDDKSNANNNGTTIGTTDEDEKVFLNALDQIFIPERINLKDISIWWKIVMNALPSYPIQSRWVLRVKFMASFQHLPSTRSSFIAWNDNISPIETFELQELSLSEDIEWHICLM